MPANMKTTFLSITLALTWGGWMTAQTAVAPPNPSPTPVAPLIPDKLQLDSPARTSRPEATSAVVVHRDPPASGGAPQDFVERKEVAIPAAGERALKASNAWESTVNPAAAGRDGRVLYTYGAGMPVVVCSPLRVCIIELEPGERFASPPHIGDSVRWDVSLETSGSGDQSTPTIILKPRDIGLDTSMFIATDRRSYYIRLISKPGEYTPMIAFEYPAEERARIQNAILRQEQERRQIEATRVSPLTATMDSIFYDYKIKGSGPFRPVRVMDDGAKTYIQMPPETVHRELPTLVIEGPGGKELVNYRVKDNYFIVDRLFDRAALLLGAGKHTQKVEIVREGAAHGDGHPTPSPAGQSATGSN